MIVYVSSLRNVRFHQMVQNEKGLTQKNDTENHAIYIYRWLQNHAEQYIGDSTWYLCEPQIVSVPHIQLQFPVNCCWVLLEHEKKEGSCSLWCAYITSCFDDHFPKESSTVDEYFRSSLERLKHRKFDNFLNNLAINFHCQTNLYWENEIDSCFLRFEVKAKLTSFSWIYTSIHDYCI